MGTMTIHIPDDLAHHLEQLAASEKKSVEELAVERLRSSLEKPSSPEALLSTLRALARPSASAVDELEAAIAASRIPVTDLGPFGR